MAAEGKLATGEVQDYCEFARAMGGLFLYLRLKPCSAQDAPA